MKGLVQTILDGEVLRRLKEDARNEGVSVACYLRKLVLASQGVESSGLGGRVRALEAKVSEIEKLKSRSRK
jgi:hypothetical protein